jgi:hypothetical protein
MNVQIDAKKKTYFRFVGLYILGVLAVVFMSISPTHGLGYGKGSYGTCQFGSCSITLSTSGTVTPNITPGSSTTCTVASDQVSVQTGASTGYTLQVNDSDTDTNLNRSGGGTIAATSGTRSSPATLAANKWGYRVDSIAGFGAGPTTPVSNVSSPSVQFAGVPALGSPDTIATTSSAATVAQITPVWYGVCSDTSIPSGVYTDTVVYTALTN